MTAPRHSVFLLLLLLSHLVISAVSRRLNLGQRREHEEKNAASTIGRSKRSLFSLISFGLVMFQGAMGINLNLRLREIQRRMQELNGEFLRR